MYFDYYLEEIQKMSLSMFRKGFLGIFHGSISARLEQDKFIINKKNAVFDSLQKDDLIILTSQKDYRWNEASIDSYTHYNIYKNIYEAKYVCYAMPPNVIAYSLNNSAIVPKDYYGAINFNNIEIYDPKQFDDWYERASIEIYRYMIEKNTNVIVIKGYGIFCYGRTIYELAKNIAVLENSCKLLNLSKI